MKKQGIPEDTAAVSLIIQVWNQNAVFLMKLKSILQQIAQRELKFCSTFQRFAEMAPKARFQELKNKVYRFHCFFLGAIQDKGKHNDGIRQRDFVCEHKSYDKYPVKKAYVSLP